MKQITTHNGKVLIVPDSDDEDYREAHRVRTRSWRLMIESLDMLQQAEILFAERTQVIKDRLGVATLTVEAVKAREADEQWRASIADADYAINRLTALAATYQAAAERVKQFTF